MRPGFDHLQHSESSQASILHQCGWWCDQVAEACSLYTSHQQGTLCQSAGPQEKFLPYFHEAGYDVTAISLRGQGRSELAPGQKDGGTIRSHADDLAEIISEMDQEPILISHSLGGLVAQRCPLVMTCPFRSLRQPVLDR